MSSFNIRKFLMSQGWRKFDECGSCGGGEKLQYKKPTLAGYEITIIIKRNITNYWLIRYSQVVSKGEATEEKLTEALQGL